MILRILRKLRDRLVTKLTPDDGTQQLSPVEQWLREQRAKFKKHRVINPDTGKLNLRYNPLAMDDGPCCFPVREGTKIEILPDGPDQSEELAFLEWLEQQGINLPKKSILKNDNQWRKIDMRYNPLANDEDFFVSRRGA